MSEPASVETLQRWIAETSPWVLLDFQNDDDPDSLPPVYLALGRRDGRIVCTAMIIGVLPDWYGPTQMTITPRVLRQVHIPEFVRAAIESSETGEQGWDDHVAELLNSLTSLKPLPRRHQYDDQHFRDVADSYRAALVARPDAPIQWLAEQTHQSPPTLRRWLQRARDKGFLGAATPGKAGEVADND